MDDRLIALINSWLVIAAIGSFLLVAINGWAKRRLTA